MTCFKEKNTSKLMTNESASYFILFPILPENFQKRKSPPENLLEIFRHLTNLGICDKMGSTCGRGQIEGSLRKQRIAPLVYGHEPRIKFPPFTQRTDHEKTHPHPFISDCRVCSVCCSGAGTVTGNRPQNPLHGAPRRLVQRPQQYAPEPENGDRNRRRFLRI